MDTTTQRQDAWDLDLRVEPARNLQSKIGLTMTTETFLTTSRMPTMCCGTNTNNAKHRAEA